jgi:tripartite-type tricarboxylate transporter receptor subunit TctC
MRRCLAWLLLVVAFSVSMAPPHSASAQQQAFPTRPITLIVPFAPGGATDIVARLLATRMGEDLGQNVVVDNRAGGGGNTGTVAAMRTAPDGHTIVLATTSQLINQYLLKSPPFDLFADLVAVALVADAPEIIAITATLPANTLAELGAAMRASAAGYNYGSAGVGSIPHVGGEVLARAMGAKMVHVPFRGSADAAREVAAGNIQMTIATHASVGSLVEAGKIKIIAAAARQRVASLPNVPTTAEAGYPGIELSNWFGIFAPRATPPHIVARLNAAFNKALGHPETAKTLLSQGIEPVRITAQQFADRLQEDGKTYKKMVEDIGLTPQ